MVIRKFTFDDLRTMKLFSDVCGTKPLDCFTVQDTTVFVTAVGDTAKAIGKAGANIKKLKSKLNTEIKVIESSSTLEALVGNYLFPIKAKKIESSDTIVSIKFGSSRERRALLNNNQKELKKLKATVARYYPKIKDIQVLQ